MPLSVGCSGGGLDCSSKSSGRTRKGRGLIANLPASRGGKKRCGPCNGAGYLSGGGRKRRNKRDGPSGSQSCLSSLKNCSRKKIGRRVRLDYLKDKQGEERRSEGKYCCPGLEKEGEGLPARSGVCISGEATNVGGKRATADSLEALEGGKTVADSSLERWGFSKHEQSGTEISCGPKRRFKGKRAGLRLREASRVPSGGGGAKKNEGRGGKSRRDASCPTSCMDCKALSRDALNAKGRTINREKKKAGTACQRGFLEGRESKKRGKDHKKRTYGRKQATSFRPAGGKREKVAGPIRALKLYI